MKATKNGRQQVPVWTDQEVDELLVAQSLIEKHRSSGGFWKLAVADWGSALEDFGSHVSPTFCGCVRERLKTLARLIIKEDEKRASDDAWLDRQLAGMGEVGGKEGE